MTDNEIIKALECCGDGLDCSNCAFDDGDESMSECTSKLANAAFDLIQRQQEEIKLLKQRRVNMLEILEAVERGRDKGIKELRDKIVEQLESERRFYNSASEHDQLIRQGVSIAFEIVKGGGGNV